MGKISENFSREEFICKCGNCGFATVDVELIDVLEDVRYHFDEPITINSGCRCKAHNEAEGGSSRSKHLEGIACDFKVRNFHADGVAAYLEDKYPDKYGIGRYNGRTHIDVRSIKARWDNRNV